MHTCAHLQLSVVILSSKHINNIILKKLTLYNMKCRFCYISVIFVRLLRSYTMIKLDIQAKVSCFFESSVLYSLENARKEMRKELENYSQIRPTIATMSTNNA